MGSWAGCEAEPENIVVLDLNKMKAKKKLPVKRKESITEIVLEPPDPPINVYVYNVHRHYHVCPHYNNRTIPRAISRSK